MRAKVISLLARGRTWLGGWSQGNRPFILVAAIVLLVTITWLGSASILALTGSNAQGVQQALPGKLAVVGAQSADFYSAPDGDVVRTLAPGTTLTAIGRTADNQWVLVYLDDRTPGWVEAGRLVVFGTDQLPVMADMAQSESATPVESPSAPLTDTQAVTATEVVTATTPAAVAATATPTNPPATATPTETATPLPTPTATPSPSPSPTPVPTNTSTPALVAMAQTEIIAVVGAGGANLYDEPGTDPAQRLAVGTALTAQARSGDGAWLYVQTATGTAGWVSTNDVVVFNVRGLPVQGAEAAAAPATADDTPVEAEAPATAVTTTTTLTDTVVAEETPAGEDGEEAPASPTVPATATRRPTPEADGRPTARIALTGSRLNVRAGPGTNYPIVEKALPNEVFVAMGRNGPGTWVQIEVAEAPDGFGWVSAEFIELSEPLVNLPISDQVSSEPVQPTATPVPPAAPADEPAPEVTVERAATNSSGNSQPVAQRTAPTGLNGKLVVQTSPGGTFYLYDLASGVLRPVTSGLDPALSPDGSQIAFVRNDSIYVIGVDGSNERMVFNERPGLRSPKWSPDGQGLVFSRSDGSYKCRDLGFGGLCPSDAQLVSDVPDIELPEELIPEECDEACQEELAEEITDSIKSRILNQFDRVERPNYMIARVEVDGNGYRDLAALNSAQAPDWSAGGIVYQSSAGIQKTSDSPDAETRQVFFDYYMHDPDVSPDGGRIVFHQRRGSHWQIFAVNSDGSGLVALTQPRTTLVDQIPSNVAPAWSPDGRHIVFLSNREENHEAGRWRVWVMDADGGNQRPLPIDLPIDYRYVLEQAVDWGR